MTTNAPPPPERQRPLPPAQPEANRRLPIPRRFQPLLLFVLVTGAISLFYPGFFSDLLFYPVSALTQILFLVYRGIPQNIIWAVFIIVALFAAIPAIIPAFPDKAPEPEQANADNRLAILAKLEADAANSQHARWELAREIHHVAMQLLTIEPDDTAEIIQQRLRSGELDLPPVIDELFSVCASLPSYRSFLEAREAARGGKIEALAALDLNAAVAALHAWRRPEGAPF